MSDQNVHDLPQNVTFDLDAWERPEKEIKPPFNVKVGGKVINMKDPAEIDWRDLATMEDPMEFLRLAMSSEDRRHLLEQDLSSARFNEFMKAYYEHYDMDEQIRKARNQSKLAGL